VRGGRTGGNGAGGGGDRRGRQTAGMGREKSCCLKSPWFCSHPGDPQNLFPDSDSRNGAISGDVALPRSCPQAVLDQSNYKMPHQPDVPPQGRPCCARCAGVVHPGLEVDSVGDQGFTQILFPRGVVVLDITLSYFMLIDSQLDAVHVSSVPGQPQPCTLGLGLETPSGLSATQHLLVVRFRQSS
jgi:hypothetical protein